MSNACKGVCPYYYAMVYSTVSFYDNLYFDIKFNVKCKVAIAVVVHPFQMTHAMVTFAQVMAHATMGCALVNGCTLEMSASIKVAIYSVLISATVLCYLRTVLV